MNKVEIDNMVKEMIPGIALEVLKSRIVSGMIQFKKDPKDMSPYIEEAYKIVGQLYCQYGYKAFKEECGDQS